MRACVRITYRLRCRVEHIGDHFATTACLLPISRPRRSDCHLATAYAGVAICGRRAPPSLPRLATDGPRRIYYIARFRASPHTHLVSAPTAGAQQMGSILATPSMSRVCAESFTVSTVVWETADLGSRITDTDTVQSSTDGGYA